ncbi:MAG: hypothetical protein WBF71_14775, partial [Microthrixaceae bacterium]
MSGFHELGDEFAGDEANDEWDATWAAYAAGDQPLSDAEILPLRTVLDLPIGMVEIRGDDPGIGLCLVESPEERRSQSTPESEFDVDSEDSPALTMTLTTDDAGRADFLVLNAGGEVVGTGALEDHESASELLDHLVAASIATDVSRVYLKAACVEVAGRGVLILSSDESARDAVTKGLLGAGARYLTDSVVATNPGIRPISGLARRRAGAEATKTVQSVVVDVVLIIDSDADVSRGPHAEPEVIADVQAVVELAHFVHPGSRTHPMALAHVAALVAGASCHRVNPADTPQLAGFLPLLPKARRNLLVVTDLSDTAGADVGWVTNDTQVPDGTASTDTPPGETLLLRFGDGALVSQASEGIRVIDTDAIQAIEQRLAVDDRRRLVPAGFGLPGCPVGNAVADLWKTTTADALPRTLPTGVVAELISRELVGADEATRERLIDVHAVARSRRDEAVSL